MGRLQFSAVLISGSRSVAHSLNFSFNIGEDQIDARERRASNMLDGSIFIYASNLSASMLLVSAGKARLYLHAQFVTPHRYQIFENHSSV